MKTWFIIPFLISYIVFDFYFDMQRIIACREYKAVHLTLPFGVKP